MVKQERRAVLPSHRAQRRIRMSETKTKPRGWRWCGVQSVDVAGQRKQLPRVYVPCDGVLPHGTAFGSRLAVAYPQPQPCNQRCTGSAGPRLGLGWPEPPSPKPAYRHAPPTTEALADRPLIETKNRHDAQGPVACAGAIKDIWGKFEVRIAQASTLTLTGLRARPEPTRSLARLAFARDGVSGSSQSVSATAGQAWWEGIAQGDWGRMGWALTNTPCCGGCDGWRLRVTYVQSAVFRRIRWRL